MADIIELRRGTAAVRPLRPPLANVQVEAQPWLLPWAVFQLSIVTWANWWFLPLGLRVERSDTD
jgi:hypothetical protein